MSLLDGGLFISMRVFPSIWAPASKSLKSYLAEGGSMSWRKWVLLIIAGQLVFFLVMTIAGWGRGSIFRLDAPSMARLGAPPLLESAYDDLSAITFPFNTSRGRAQAVAAYAGTLQEWTDVPLGHSIDFFSLNPINDFHAFESASNITYLFVVPFQALPRRGYLRIYFKTHQYKSAPVAVDSEKHYAIMSASVPNNRDSWVDSSLAWLLELFAVTWIASCFS